MTTPYIGSKISLISKSEIRYEGILYTVDPKESTIALAKVRSYGTEDRPTENPVPPRQEVYEYIIFKASDIKDLVVCETPQPVPSLMPGLPYDPAIVSVSKHPQTGSQLPTANASGVAASSTGFGDGSKASDAISQATAQLGGFQISKGHASTASGNSSRPSTPLHRGVSPSVDAGVQAGGPQSRAPGAGRQTVSNRNGQSGGNGYQAQRYRRGSGGYQNNRGGYVNGPRDQRDQRDQHNFNRVGRGGNGGFRGRGNMGGGGMMRGGRGGNYQGYQGGYQRGQQQNYGNRGGNYYPRGGARGGRGDGTERVKYDNDYDFEKANEQFQETLSHLKDGKTPKEKDDEKSEVEKGDMKKSDSGSEVHGAESEDHESSEKACYDKTKSFFDKISCEALERSEGNTGRPNNWRKERELNQETFGQNAVRNYNFRRGQPRGGGNVMGGGYRRGGNMRGGYNKYRSGGNF